MADATGECSVSVAAPTTTDSCAGTITGTTSDPTTYTEQGTYTITWSFSDGNGNTSTATQRVIVRDVTAPVLTAAAAQEVVLAAGCSVTIPDVTGTATDNCGSVTITQSPVAGSVVTATNGQQIHVTVTATDAAGNTDVEEVVLTAQDKTAPLAPATIAAATAECAVTVTEVPTAEDNCGGTITGTTDDPLTYTQQGKYKITWSFNDGNGNVSTAVQEVIVADVTAPVQPTLADATGECSVTVAAPTTTDNCAGTITGTTVDPTTYEEQGTFTITWRFDDGNGNITTATQQVIVDDVSAPVIAAVEPVTAPADAGQCGATLSITPPEVTDNCEARPARGTRHDGAALDAQYPVGTTTITWNATDANGNQAVAVTQTVTVTDTQAPTITAPADVEVAADASCNATNVTLGTPTTADNCSVASVTNNAPATYRLGETEVIWTVTDAAGLTASATQLVRVVDETAPILTAAADQNVSLGAACTIIIPDVRGTATDNCSAATISQSPAAGTAVAATDGETITVLVTATDAAGNTATDEVVLTAQDETAPVLAAAADQTAGTENGTCTATIALPDAAFSDNCAGSQVNWVMSGATTGNGQGQVGTYTFNKGVTTVSYTATDAAGNSATDQLLVTVTDDDAPVLTVPANIVVQTQPDKCGAAVNYDVTASDNCSAVTPVMTAGLASGATFPVGTTTVTYKATDEAGNASIQSFTVTVENEVPSNLVVNGPVSPVQLGTEVTLTASFDDANIATAVWNWGNGGTTTQTISGSPISATYKYPQPGVYSVVLTVTDYCGASISAPYNYVVVFDPTGGFVTGGGWIESPVGAMKGEKYGVTGTANFGFNAKYKNGKNNTTEVEGHTNFQFKAGDLHFSSFEHEDMSLVIAGKKATYTGYGTVNGSGVHRFRVIAIDGSANGDNGPDEFRIKIWGNGSSSEADVIYDNQRGVAESSDLATVLGGGSIVIHKEKSTVKVSSTAKLTANAAALPVEPSRFLNYPNPYTDRTTIAFSFEKEERFALEVYDVKGAVVKRYSEGLAEAGKRYEFEFSADSLPEGVYFARLVTSSGVKTIKMVLKK
ncbi:HYR domain-containing protein [Pontibacter kalidii]|uniref:HYR domain-containing protein n=1 Tax=Pontibacter kalidii TaxID=2592049 RepID=UPI002258C5B4|nr:HYR domain-containing protein [Pontibacter kalidii]